MAAPAVVRHGRIPNFDGRGDLILAVGDLGTRLPVPINQPVDQAYELIGTFAWSWTICSSKKNNKLAGFSLLVRCCGVGIVQCLFKFLYYVIW